MKMELYQTCRAGFLVALASLGGCGWQSGETQQPAAGVQAAGAEGVAKTQSALKPPTDDVGPASLLETKRSSDAGVVPNNVIVKFKATGARRVTECVGDVVKRGGTFGAATADKSSSLDAVMARFGVKKAKSLLPWRAGLSTKAAQARQAAMSRAAGPRPDLTNVYLLEIEGDVEDAAEAFRRDPHVDYAQANYRVRVSYVPNDPYFSSSGSFGQSYRDLWGLEKMEAATAWDSARGQGVVVAVVDTGIDSSHPDLAGNVWTNPNETANGLDDDGNGKVDDLSGWSFVSNDGDTTDRFGHGTHVAGTIAAQDNNGLGMVGVAPDARLMPVKGLDDYGNGDLFSLAQAILYAAESGADVINNSWGCNAPCPSNPVVEEAVLSAHGLGSVVVFAAGNASEDIRGFSPNNSPYVISVGATTPGDAKPGFSNFGAIDVGAPGAGLPWGPPADQPERGVLSLKSAVCHEALCPPSLVVGQQYLRLSGTSMAAPHVAGLAALVLSQHPTYTPEQVRQVIRRSADDVNLDGYDTLLGYGRVNARRAMNEAVPLETLITSPLGRLTSSSVEVRGTARGAGFASYRLEYGVGVMPASWTLIANSTTPATEALLATWDASLVVDGDVTLRLTALTGDGRAYEDRQLVTLDRAFISSPAANSTLGASTLDIMGTVVAPRFERYEIAVLTSSGVPASGGQLSLVGGGLSPIATGVLAVWNTTGLAPDHYQLRLTVHSTDGSSVVKTTRLVVDPALHSGFPIQIPGFGMAAMTEAPTLIDLNHDGRSEIVVGYGKEVRMIQHDGSDVPGWPQNINSVGAGPDVHIQRAPAIGDIDGNGGLEVVGGTNNGYLFVWREDGSWLPGWPRYVGGYINSVALADLSMDGVLDIVVADWSGAVKAYRDDGSLLPGFPAQVGWSVLFAPTVADVDRDGAPEIAVTFQRNSLTLLDRRGAVRAGWPKQGTYVYQAAGDLDGDGDLEIVAVHEGGVSAFHHDGTSVSGFPVALPLYFINVPSLGDLDGDGRAEVVVGGMHLDLAAGVVSSRLYVLNGTGTVLPGWPRSVVTGQHTFQGYQGAALGDLDADGQPDIVACRDLDSNADRPLEALRLDGTLIPGFPRPLSTPGAHPTTSPALGDTDGDGLLELVFLGIDGRLFTYDLAAEATAALPWPMIHHDARHTIAGPAAPTSYRRTVVFIYGETQPGQDMFVRGGIDHDYAASHLGRSCTSTTMECAIPIVHRNLRNATTAPWKSGDGTLDWYGAEAGQSSEAEGSALDWTTNLWPSEWGPEKTVATDGYGTPPLHLYGRHYWMLDVDMDCSKTVNGWFELKSFISNGPGWESDITQPGAPYSSRNHFAQCGRINVFQRSSNSVVFADFGPEAR